MTRSEREVEQDTQDKKDKVELDEIVSHSVERAEALYPKRKTSLRVKLVYSIIALILVVNAVIGILDTAVLSQTQACQKQQTRTLIALRNNNQTATTSWINSISDQIKARKLTPANIESLRIIYNEEVSRNNRSIDQAVAIKCS